MHAEQHGPSEEINQASSADLVSRLAQDAQRRSEEARTEAQRPPPAFVLDVEQSDVAYTLPPRFIPLTHMDHVKFVTIMDQRFSLRPDLSGVRIDPSQLAKMQQQEDFESAVMEHALRDQSSMVAFVSGRYRVSDLEFVPIISARLNFETVIVAVQGPSRVAEAVAQEIVELISACAGASRSWASVEPHVQLVNYATRTRVALGAAFDGLLSAKFRSMINDHVVSGERLGASAGPLYARYGLKPAKEAVVTVALDDLIMRLTKFDPSIGISTHTQFAFHVTSLSDYNSGDVSVSSELSYESHLVLLEHLLAIGEAD